LLADDRAYIGASGAGSVYVLERAGDTWSFATALQPFEVARGSQFGHTLEVVDGELWVGAPGANASNGRIYRFIEDAGEWRSAVRLDADSADGTAWPFNFGYAIAAVGDRAVVGMPMRDFGEGRAVVVAR